MNNTTMYTNNKMAKCLIKVEQFKYETDKIILLSPTGTEVSFRFRSITLGNLKDMRDIKWDIFKSILDRMDEQCAATMTPRHRGVVIEISYGMMEAFRDIARIAK